MQLKIIRHQDKLKKYPQRTIVAIGNFDGVHCGHQKVLDQLKSYAEKLQIPAWLIIFEPQSKEYFSPNEIPARITSLREKIIALKNYGIENVACLTFNAKLANLSAEEFIQKILVDYFNVAYVIVGEDFHFGKQRSGNLELLRKCGELFNYQVITVKALSADQQRVSSTRIRQALADHHLLLAKQLLGRPYTACGRVIQGEKRGRLLGFPTANIRLGKRILPLSGVYAVRVHGLGEPVPGVANAGTRPTVDGIRRSLEVHLFGFDQEVYGQYIEIEFIQYVRSEKRFDSLQSLQEQIKQDVLEARKILLNISEITLKNQ